MARIITEILPNPRVQKLAIGVFDGVHLGHREILRETLSGAGSSQAAAVLTFEPHPLEVVAPEYAPARLTTEEQKVRLLQASGMTEVLVVRFDPILRSLSAVGFVEKIREIFPNLTEIVVGPNWGFGHQREGNVDTLQQLGASRGFRARAVHLLPLRGQPVSSTRIREAISRRNFAEASELLGYSYSVEGRVIAGHQRGRTIGFPTANISDIHQLMPPLGVYAGYVEFNGLLHPSLINYGTRPTVSQDLSPLLEAHLIGFHGDLYHRAVRVSDFQFIREEKRFQNVSDLQQQIQQDLIAAQGLLHLTAKLP